MRGKTLIMLIVVWGLTGGSGIFLSWLQTHQQVGDPGVKVVEEPIYDPQGGVAGEKQIDLPAAVEGFQSARVPVTQIELDWLPEDTTFGKRHYKAHDGFEALMTAVLMGTDRGSIHKPEICLTGQGWQVDQSEATTIRMQRPEPYDLPVMRLITSIQTKGRDGRAVRANGVFLYWFVADGQLTASHGERMWWMARDLMTKATLQRWAYVAVFATCRPGQEEATFDRLKELIQRSVPQFQLVPEGVS